MHKDLEKAFKNLVEIIKSDGRCKGGWHYGSVGRGTSDIYSDYDPVFLVTDKDFEQFALDVPKFLTEISDELLICWAENYNSNFFKNFCNVIRLGNNLHQHDFFIINSDYPDEWWCRQHCKGCTKDNIFFDRTGETAAFLDKGYTTDNYIPDTVRTIETYWFHAMMLVKYFKRNDIFKLIKNIHDFLFHAHVDLLLSHYDTLDWGGWESKVKHCVPIDKQEHLKMYFTTPEISILKTTIKECFNYFRNDAEEICKINGIDYQKNVSSQIIEYFNRELIDNKLEIKPITENDYQLIVDWNNGKDKDYLIQWAGPKLYNYPITIEQIMEHDKDISSQIYIIFKEGKPIGSIELENIDKQLLTAHISRFIICDEYKNQGLGTAILRQLINMSFAEIGLNILTLSVFCFNSSAIRCYEKVGFLVREHRKNDNPNWDFYLMEIKK